MQKLVFPPLRLKHSCNDCYGRAANATDWAISSCWLHWASLRVQPIGLYSRFGRTGRCSECNRFSYNLVLVALGIGANATNSAISSFWLHLL